jgi:hypothetical protein
MLLRSVRACRVFGRPFLLSGRSTEAPLIDTVKSQISKQVESRRILELPGRNTLNGLALLQSGALPNQNGRPGSGFSVNGGRTRSNNFTIDGANNNDQSLSIPRQGLPPEAIREFQLVTNNFSAEYGRNSGSYVNVITKSGTNEFHGILQYSWLGNGLDALTTGQERAFNATLDRARSGLDQPHRFVMNWVYQVPSILENNGVLNRVFSGWELSGVATFASGTPFTVFNAENALGIINSALLTTVATLQRPSINVNGTPGTGTSPTETSPYFVLNKINTGVIGTLGRNSERTGGTNNWNLALVKNTKTFGETQSFQIRWEAFNVFNRRNFTTIPASTVSANTVAATFLNLGQTNVGGRSMLFTARYFF